MASNQDSVDISHNDKILEKTAEVFFTLHYILFSFVIVTFDVTRPTAFLPMPDCNATVQ